jgi:ABC-type lipoprotein release transport system permease subunit
MEPGKFIPVVQELSDYLKSEPRVKNFSFRTVAQGMVSTASATAGVQVYGIDPATEIVVSGFDAKLKEGKGFQVERKGQVVISKRLAKKLKIKNGNKLVLTFTDSSGALVKAAFRVAALYQTANTPLDEVNVYVRQQELNELLGIPGQSHEAVIQLHDGKELAPIKIELQHRFQQLQVESWQELSPETELMVNTIDIYSYIIILLVLFALAFGIVNSMLMAVLERTHEIGIITALGFNRLRLSILILCESVLLTLVGTPLGIAISFMLINFYHERGIDLYHLREDMMSRFGFSTVLYPEFPSNLVFPIVGFVVITAILSGLYPVWRALKMEPVDALRK